MRNEIRMYALKPVVSLPDTLHHTKTMYEMRNIHEERSRNEHTGPVNEIVPDIKEQGPLPEYNLLEERQEKILAQLAELKQQVLTLCTLLKTTDKTATIEPEHENQEPINVNLIVHANPKIPPYSTLALKHAWADTDIRIKTYVHSSIIDTVPLDYETTIESPKKNVINLTLIWKDVEDLELVTGFHSYKIAGEINFLRYISRLINSRNYECSKCPEEVNRINLILDLCYSIHYQSRMECKQELMSLIAKQLNAESFDKKEPDIGDIAAWSTIKQIFPKCPPKLEKWFKACDKRFHQ